MDESIQVERLANETKKLLKSATAPRKHIDLHYRRYQWSACNFLSPSIYSVVQMTFLICELIRPQYFNQIAIMSDSSGLKSKVFVSQKGAISESDANRSRQAQIESRNTKPKYTRCGFECASNEINEMHINHKRVGLMVKSDRNHFRTAHLLDSPLGMAGVLFCLHVFLLFGLPRAST